MLARAHWRELGRIERDLRADIGVLSTLDGVALASDYVVARMALLGAKVRALCTYLPEGSSVQPGEYAIRVELPTHPRLHLLVSAR